MDWATLKRNKLRLMQSQHEWYSRPRDGAVRLNVGCGGTRYPGYINVDISQGDVLSDIRAMPVKPGKVNEISCHHVLEHLALNEVVPVLQSFYAMLRHGGVLEIGMPDLGLLCEYYLGQSEEIREAWAVKTLYGSQENKHMFHRSGFTMQGMKKILIGIGFLISLAYQYDGNHTPSFCVYATKGAP
jgi:hypothetical protein